MLNPFTYKLVWLAVLFLGCLILIVPMVAGGAQAGIVTVPIGIGVVWWAVFRLRKRRRIRAPRRKTWD
jgi:hypothetical protein